MAAFYDRRIAIEEQIRDTKGARFGFQLVWTQIKTPQTLARFTILIGLAILLLTAIGYAISKRRPDIRLTSKTKGPRLSFVTVDYLFFHYVLAHHTLSVSSLKQNMPPPAFRSSPWLSRCQKKEGSKVIDGQISLWASPDPDRFLGNIKMGGGILGMGN